MQRKLYIGEFFTDLLREEIYAAFPSLQPTPNPVLSGVMDDPFFFQYDPNGVYVNFPDEILVEELDAVMAAHDPNQLTQEHLFRNRIVSIAQSSVGVALADLTSAQIKSLMAILLYKAGGVDPIDMTVKPLNQWV